MTQQLQSISYPAGVVPRSRMSSSNRPGYAPTRQTRGTGASIWSYNKTPLRRRGVSHAGNPEDQFIYMTNRTTGQRIPLANRFQPKLAMQRFKQLNEYEVARKNPRKYGPVQMPEFMNSLPGYRKVKCLHITDDITESRRRKT